jgi:hypothetical protein
MTTIRTTENISSTNENELEAAEAIAFERIGAGHVEDDAGTMCVEDGGKMAFEQCEVLVISHAIVERDVEVAHFLAKRKVVRAVHREGEHCRLVAKDRCGAVPLMHIAVDNCDRRRGRIKGRRCSAAL